MPIDQQPQASTGLAAGRQPRSLWRNRDYLLLVCGQVVSQLGSQFSLLAFPLLALFISGSPAHAGLIGSMRLLPYFMLSLPAGALIDRWDRKRLMFVCNVGRGLCLLSIPIALALGHLTLLQLYLVSLLEGTFFVFFDLAELASLPHVVAREQIIAATTQSEMAYNLSFMLGPALGGIIYGLGKSLPFLLDACSYLISLCSLLLIKTKFQRTRETRPEKLWIEMRAGLLWIWHQPLILFLACMGTLFHLFFDGIALIVIVLARQTHAAPLLIGLVLAMDGVGSTLGLLLFSRLSKRFSFHAISSVCYWIWAMLWLTMLLAGNMLTLGIILALIYCAIMIFDLAQFSYRRLLIPDELQGRVNSVFRLIAYSGAPLGLTLAGLLLQIWGPSMTITVLGIGVIGMALLITFNSHLRRARPLSEISREKFVEIPAD
ncbi:MAG TPA: MFS transporter [Ktedonobacteraceae bacterium]